MLKSLWSWLTDPNAQGRKRAICAVAAIVSGALRGASAAIASACTSDLIPDVFCRLDPSSAAAVIDAMVVWANAYLVPGSDLIAALMGLWGLWDARAKAAKVAAAALMVVTLAGNVAAQAPAPSPSPKTSATMEADTSGALVLDLSGWTLAVITRGEKREYVGGRVTLDAPVAGKVRAFARADVTGTQDFASVESFAQYQTFRSVEGYMGLRYVIHPAGLAVGALVGTSWSIEGDDGPLDPRMATALAVVRLPLPGDGYGYIGGGHRGPVGGAALIASVTYPLGPTRWIADYDYPLTKAEDGTLRPWVLKTGVAVPIKRWVIR